MLIIINEIITVIIFTTANTTYSLFFKRKFLSKEQLTKILDLDKGDGSVGRVKWNQPAAVAPWFNTTWPRFWYVQILFYWVI